MNKIREQIKRNSTQKNLSVFIVRNSENVNYSYLAYNADDAAIEFMRDNPNDIITSISLSFYYHNHIVQGETVKVY